MNARCVGDVIYKKTATYPCGLRRLRFLEQVPHLTSQISEPAAAEVFSRAHLKALRLLAHLFEDVLLALVISVLTAGLEVELVDAPVLEVVGKRQHTHLLDQMQLPGAVEVEHGRERARVTVEVKFHRVQAAQHYTNEF